MRLPWPGNRRAALFSGDPNEPPAPRSPIMPLLVLIALLYGGVLTVLWRAGLLELDDSKSDARVVAAALTLVGALIAASLTLVGVLLKHSLDERNLQLADDTNARLRLEASIKAVELLTVADGQPASQTRQAGALFVLANLGQVELALTLLSEIWPKRGVSSAAGAAIVDYGLRAKDPRLQEQAAGVLADNARLLPNVDGDVYEFPDSAIDTWPVSVTEQARELLLRAMLRTLTARTPDEWHPSMLHSFVVDLDLVRRVDPSARLRGNAALAAHALLHSGALGDISDVELFRPGGDTLRLAALRAELDAMQAQAYASADVEGVEVADRLRTAWFLEKD